MWSNSKSSVQLKMLINYTVLTLTRPGHGILAYRGMEVTRAWQQHQAPGTGRGPSAEPKPVPHPFAPFAL